MDKGKGEVVGVVREWKPQQREGIDAIHGTIDSWGRAEEKPKRDYAAIEAAVDRITKRVKTRKVVVEETVTEYVDANQVEFADESPWDGQAEAQAPTADAGQAIPPPVASGKRKPKILGWFGPKGQKSKVDKAVAARSDAAESDYQPQCGALTEDGAQCRNSARDGSKYCASHKGYHPVTAQGIAKRVEGDAWDPNDAHPDRASVRRANTKPKVRKAKDTKLVVRKPAKARKAAKPAARGKAKRRKSR